MFSEMFPEGVFQYTTDSFKVVQPSALEQFQDDLTAIDCESSLKTIKGIDETIIGVIETLMINGRLKYYEELTEEIPEGLIEMMKIPGLGSKRVKLLFDGLGINSVAGLKYECDRNVVARLKDLPRRYSQIYLMESETCIHICMPHLQIHRCGMRFFYFCLLLLFRSHLSSGRLQLKKCRYGALARCLKLLTSFLLQSYTPLPVLKPN